MGIECKPGILACLSAQAVEGIVKLVYYQNAESRHSPSGHGGTRHDIILTRGVEAMIELEVHFGLFVWRPGVSILQNRIRYRFVVPSADNDYMRDCSVLTSSRRTSTVSTAPGSRNFKLCRPTACRHVTAPSPFPRLRQVYNIFRIPYVLRRETLITSCLSSSAKLTPRG